MASNRAKLIAKYRRAETLSAHWLALHEECEGEYGFGSPIMRGIERDYKPLHDLLMNMATEGRKLYGPDWSDLEQPKRGGQIVEIRPDIFDDPKKTPPESDGA